MKKKSVFLSKVFAVALAASMAFSTPYASAETVTTSTTYDGGKQVVTMDNGFWSAWSDFYRLSGDFDVTFEISNKSNMGGNFKNAVIALSNGVDYAAGAPAEIPGYTEYMVMRIDNWCWSPGDGHANITTEGVDVVRECDWNWDTFTTVMSDAKITLNATRTGDDFAFIMKVVGADGNTYNQSYKFTTKADQNVNIFFSGENADVSILSYTINSGGTAGDTTPGDTTPAPGGDTTPETPGDTTPATPDDANPDDSNQTPIPDTTDPGNNNVTPPSNNLDDPGTDNDNTGDSDSETEAPAPSLNKKKGSVKVGKTLKLKVKNAEGTVKWSSNKKKVAKVNKKGVVTGVKAGTATITAKVDGKTLKCKVTVKK